jgi:hypothetical protein
VQPDLDAPPRNGHVAVARINGEYRLYAAESIQAGELLFTIEGVLTVRPSRYSIQVGPQTHVEIPPGTPLEEQFDRMFWRFLNHSCDPNLVIRGRDVVALRAIRAMEELSFNYLTTEFEMAVPFECHCGAPSCTGVIRGFRFLDRAARRRLRPWLAPHLLERLV